MTAEALIDRLLAEVRRSFCGDAAQEDDVTCVVVRVTAKADVSLHDIDETNFHAARTWATSHMKHPTWCPSLRPRSIIG